jgi:ABC-type sugar transport system ATPase subunit
MANADFLQMRGIGKFYGGTQALRGVDFSATVGEVHAIVGENGAGKSTLVKIIAGAVKPNTGRIQLDGKTVEIDTPICARRMGIRAVHQVFSLVPHLTVTENILMGQEPKGNLKWWVDWSRAHQRTAELLKKIGFTGINMRLPVSNLSVSQQQMVEIAKAVAERPRILILDEPTAALSHEELKRFFALIQALKEESTLILYVSHRLDEVLEIADRITVLKDGELVGTVHSQEIDQCQLIKMMVGRPLSRFYPHRNTNIGSEILSVKGLSHKGSFQDISFSLARGEILGFFGLVGSGRTQLARCIFGAELPDSGQISLEGKDARIKSPRDAVKSGIALLTEDRKRDGLVMSCSIRDNVSLATMEKVSSRGILNRRLMDTQVRSKVQQLDIRPPQIERLVRTLSGGNQQKVALAKWLLSQAKVFILDEPTRAVDVATKVDIYQIISDLADRGAGILLISSEMPELLGMCDRILVMREGRLKGEFTKAVASEGSILAAAVDVI